MVYLSNVWPRKSTSAASDRVFSFMSMFRKNNYDMTFICSAKPSPEQLKEFKSDHRPTVFNLDPNDPPEAGNILKSLKKGTEFAIFDGFVAEEYFSHYMYRYQQNIMRVLDTQDIHSLRKARQKVFEALQSKNPEGDEFTYLPEVLNCEVDTRDPLCARELLSLYRSDLIFVCSDYEQMILKKKFLIDSTKVQFFFVSKQFGDSKFPSIFEVRKAADVNPTLEFDYKFKTDQNYDSELDKTASEQVFKEKEHFFFIGNYQHAPNRQAVKTLLKIWPRIRERLPEAQLHIYGSDFPQAFAGIESIPGVKKRNLMKSLESIARYRVLLAPLMFGAGAKGSANKKDLRVLDSKCALRDDPHRSRVSLPRKR